jgi:pimeloyl-ACP methyl ester carboxylesterase
MYQIPSAVWINVNPSFRRFDRPLVNLLSRKIVIAEWQYCQSPDEPASIEVALVLLHDYLKQQSRPVHLLGHGTGGLVGLLYARLHPERVRSLTLLSVGVYPAIDWQAHYYVLSNLLPCSREMLLMRTVQNLFGDRLCFLAREFRYILEQDLLLSPSPHNLYQNTRLGPGTVPVPMLACAGDLDPVIDRHLLQGWEPWLKETDRLWSCTNGRYFFPYSHPHLVSSQIIEFWHSLASVETEAVPVA